MILRYRATLCVLWLVTGLGLTGCTTLLGDFKLGASDAGAPPGTAGAGGSGPIVDAGEPENTGPPPTDGPCAERSKVCQGFDLYSCTDGGFQKDTTCPALCSNGACTGLCRPGETKCDGNTFFTCKGPDGIWDNGVPCSFPCGPLGCTGICAPGSKRCNMTSVQTCAADGSWKDTSKCPFVCNNSACTGSCIPTTRQCNGNQPQVCDANGQWADEGAACPGVCSSGMCAGVCTSGDTQCNGRTVQTCVAGLWVNAAMQCPFVCQTGACTGDCLPGGAGSPRCVIGDALETCDANGHWSPMACPFICRLNACTGVCTPGTLRCNGPPGPGQMQQRCTTEAAWLTNSICTYVCDMGVCGVCNPGSKQCFGNMSQLCDSKGQWANAGTCANGCLDGGVCAP